MIYIIITYIFLFGIVVKICEPKKIKKEHRKDGTFKRKIKVGGMGEHEDIYI